MSEKTGIAWCNHTFNPWSGCVKVSAGCANCYAANLPPSMRRGAIWGKDALRIPASDAYWRGPIAWNKAAIKAGERRRVFCASVADVFEARDDLGPLRARLFDLIEATPQLDWLLLTKRPEEVPLRIPLRWFGGWPPNVWIGTSIEDQAAADERIPHLLRVPARVRFLSCEPLLGPVDLTRWLGGQPVCCGYYEETDQGPACCGCPCPSDPELQWVIVGGESGLRARPMSPSWVRSLRDQCGNAGVPFFLKQWGEWRPGELNEDHMQWLGKHEAGRMLDGVEHSEFPDPA